MSRHICRGASFERSRLNVASPLLLLDINVQISGADTIDVRQYRHTCVDGMIDFTSSALLSGTSRAMREMISGGNLFTGCKTFRKEGISLRTSRALVSRLSIYTDPHHHAG